MQNLHNETHVHEAAEDDFWITQDGENVVESNLAFGRISSKIGFQPGFDISSLILVQPFGCLGARFWQRWSVRSTRSSHRNDD